MAASLDSLAVCGGDEFIAARMSFSRSWQGAAIYLTVRSQRKGIEKHKVRRDHIFGKFLSQKLSQLFRRNRVPVVAESHNPPTACFLVHPPAPRLRSWRTAACSATTASTSPSSTR